MEKISCGTNKCPNKIKYHHDLEECYYCKSCALTLFKKDECTKIGSISETQYLLTLCKNLCEEVEEYVSKEQLALKWKHELEAHKEFKAEIDSIEDELKETLDTKRLSNLTNLEIKISDLKSKITDSDVFIKYLKHKKLTKHIIKERIEKKELATQIVCDLAEVYSDVDRPSWMGMDKNNYVIERIDSESYESLEFEELEQPRKVKLNCMPILSYNAFEALYKKFIGQQITINSGSTLTFDLNEDKCVDLMKALSKHSLPNIIQLNLNKVPAASQEVRDFMTNSPAQNVFYFNFTKQAHLVGSRYFEALKAVAARTSEVFHLSYTSFSADEFWEIIKAAKHVKELGFRAGTIHFYNEKDFLDGMENCKIEHISLEHLGSHGIGNWATNPVRFENLISSISKCAPLAKSLKTLNIRCCDVSRDKAQGILDKYNLNEVSLDGI